jgi:hypothetical protein
MSTGEFTDDQFAPDLKEHPELVARDQGLQKRLDRAMAVKLLGL